MARDSFGVGEFYEIFVDTPLALCKTRDPKGLYARAAAGGLKNFTGIDSPYEPPLNPELVLPTASGSAEDLADRVIAHLKSRGVIP
jgi:adenylylsulfate kinase-like enzyme